MLNDLLILTNLLLQSLHKARVNFRFADLTLQQSSKSLALLHVESKL